MQGFTQIKKRSFTTLAGIVVVATSVPASADILLCVDLSVTDQITITATDGLSIGDAGGTALTGVLLTDFFVGSGPSIFEFGFGDLGATGDITGGSPGLFNDSGSAGLNVFSWTDSFISIFVTGSVAFTGSATWDLDPTAYSAALGGNTSGDIYAFADTDDDIPSSTHIGEWAVKVPAPGSMALLGLGGFVGSVRRR